MWRSSKNLLKLTQMQRSLRPWIRNASSGSSAGGGAFKAILWTTGAWTVGAGGTVGYAWYDPEFRRTIEKNVPQTKDIFQTLLGAPRDAEKPVVDFQNVKKLGDKISSAASTIIPARKEEKESSASQKPVPMTPSKTPAPTKAASPPASPPSSSKKQILASIPDDKQEIKDKKEPNDDAELEKRWKARDEEMEKIHKKLEQELQKLLSKVENAIDAAVDAKLKARTVIEQHTKRVRAAVGELKSDGNDPWQAVNEAYEQVKKALKTDNSLESEARSHLDRLRKAINDGLASKNTSDHPILTKASETLNRWNQQLEEAASRVRQAQTEQKITSEFKKLIEEGREQFSKELKSILPNVDIHAKGAKLTEDELNALIVHAHIRVDQLRSQLLEQQLREQQHINQALERQKAMNVRLTEEKLEAALSNYSDAQELELRKKLQEARTEFEEELRTQMRRQAAAHSDHLEEVVKNQKERLESQYKNDLGEAILKERDIFNRQIATAIARLNAIESALEGRADQDSENRRAKELWLACQHLRKAILHGRPEGKDVEKRRKPLIKEVKAILEAGTADPFVKTLAVTIDSEAVNAGVYTQDDLVERFEKVKKVCRRTALIGDNGGTLLQYFVSLLQSFFLFDWVKPDMKELNQIDPAKIDTVGILWRASYLVEKFDFESAIKLLLLLKGEPARVASDWINDARLHLETKRTAELLLAHASAVSMRTIY